MMLQWGNPHAKQCHSMPTMHMCKRVKFAVQPVIVGLWRFIRTYSSTIGVWGYRVSFRFSGLEAERMWWQSVFDYAKQAWEGMVVAGVIGYVVAASKPISTIVKAVMDHRKGKGRVKAEGMLLPDFQNRQEDARRVSRGGYMGNLLIECLEVKVRNIGTVPAFVEDVWLTDSDGSVYWAYKISTWSNFLVRLGEEAPTEIPPGSNHVFLVRVPFEKDISELLEWSVSFNNGILWKVRLKTFRQRLPSWVPFSSRSDHSRLGQN